VNRKKLHQKGNEEKKQKTNIKMHLTINYA